MALTEYLAMSGPISRWSPTPEQEPNRSQHLLGAKEGRSGSASASAISFRGVVHQVPQRPQLQGAAATRAEVCDPRRAPASAVKNYAADAGKQAREQDKDMEEENESEEQVARWERPPFPPHSNREYRRLEDLGISEMQAAMRKVECRRVEDMRICFEE